MKSLLILVAVTSMNAQAQTPPDLDKAFQREYVYLNSQKEALLQQKRQTENTLRERAGRLKREVEQMQRELAHLTAENDENHEQLVTLEKQRRDLVRRGSSLESTFKKASQTLIEAEKALRFELGKEKIDPSLPDKLKIADLAPIFDQALILLRQSAQEDSFEGTFNDENDRLAQGKITRLGRVAAFVDRADGRYMLGPNGAGGLKILERTDGTHAFFFDNLNEAARLTKPATWVERLADFGPLLFLAMMLILVAGLFFVLVKI